MLSNYHKCVYIKTKQLAKAHDSQLLTSSAQGRSQRKHKRIIVTKLWTSAFAIYIPLFIRVLIVFSWPFFVLFSQTGVLYARLFAYTYLKWVENKLLARAVPIATHDLHLFCYQVEALAVGRVDGVDEDLSARV